MSFWFWRRKKVVRAQEFVLEDTEGRERAALRTDPAGNHLLLFREQGGRVRCFVGTTPTGTPRVALFYGEGKGTVQLEANDESNSAVLMISSAAGSAKIVLAVTPNGAPVIVVYDQQGSVAHMAPAIPQDAESPSESTSVDWDSFLKN